MLQGGERDLDGGPGQVAGVVEGGWLVDLLPRLVASLLHLRWLLRLFLVPSLCLLMGLGRLGDDLCLIYLYDIRVAGDGGKGGEGEDQYLLIGLDCHQRWECLKN